MSKKIISVATLLLATVVPISALAAVTGTDLPTIPVMDALYSIINWLFAILLIVAAIFIIIAGYMFVTAQGDAEKTKSARNFVMYALIGVLVAFLAKGLVVLVGLVLGQTVTF